MNTNIDRDFQICVSVPLTFHPPEILFGFFKTIQRDSLINLAKSRYSFRFT